MPRSARYGYLQRAAREGGWGIWRDGGTKGCKDGGTKGKRTGWEHKPYIRN